MRELTLPIVGINHPNADKAKTNRRSELMLLGVASPLELRLEPDNPHDPRAIGVWSPSGIQVGYVGAERAQWLGGKIRDGEEVQVILQGVATHVGWMRVRIGGGAPTLPPVREGADELNAAHDDGDGFWADPEGPEWGA